MKNKYSFWKMSGSGNDFVVMDNRDKAFSSKPELIAKICDRHEGVGADGMLLLEQSKKASFRMAYFNSDGSRASMCGNGARCMAFFAKEQHVVRSHFSFETDAGIINAAIDENIVKIQLSDAHSYVPSMKVKVKGKTYPVAFLNTGVPHAVVFVKNIEKLDVRTLGREFRFHSAFGKAGTNVNFVQKLDHQTLRVRTYERGVEDETLACGTGVSASAIVSALKGLVSLPALCKTTGGDILEVNFERQESDASKPATQVTLCGPVRVTFKGEVTV